MKLKTTIIAAIFGAFIFSQLLATALAQDEADLAKQLANPVAALISVPIQVNYDENIGADDGGAVWKINIQPVIPFPSANGGT